MEPFRSAALRDRHEFFNRGSLLGSGSTCASECDPLRSLLKPLNVVSIAARASADVQGRGAEGVGVKSHGYMRSWMKLRTL